MIKIQEHLNHPNADIILNKCAQAHWAELNPKYKSKDSFKPVSLIEKLKKYYGESNKPEYIRQFAKNNKIIAKRQRKLFLYLKKNKFENLKNIIIAKPDKFNSILSEIFTIINRSDLWTKNGNRIYQTAFGKLLSDKVFDYKKFRKSTYCINRFIDLGFSNVTCPYCNDRSVEIVKKNYPSLTGKEHIAYFDLDHFYPKSLYPFFTLSFFNLIPSCHICNSSEKRDLDFSINTNVHPYYDSFDDMYDFKISSKTLFGDSIDEISFDQKIFGPYNTTIEDLNLLNRYNNRFHNAEKLVIFFVNRFKTCKTQQEKDDFASIIFELKDVPRKKHDILKFQNGKLFRDILRQIDINDLLKI